MESTAHTLTALGFIFSAALLFEAIGRRTRLPRVTMLLTFGFAIGPSGFDLMPETTRAWFPMVTEIALLMIGFLLGGKLTRKDLRGTGRLVVGISISVVVVTLVFVAAGLLAIGTSWPVALLLAAISTSTAPAAVTFVVREAGGDTPFARTLLAVVAIDDVWGLLVFSFAFAVSLMLTGNGDSTSVFIHALWELGGAAALGIALGLPVSKLTGRIDPGEPSLYEALGVVLLCGGLAHWLGVSVLLAAVVLGTTVANLASHHSRPFHAIEGIEVPFMILFFVLAGASLEVEALSHAGLAVLTYVALRITGRFVGSQLGGAFANSSKEMRWMGIALLPQAGVPLGMALVAAQRLPEFGEAILTPVIASTIVFELIGPIATRFALDRASAASDSGAIRS